MRIVNLVFFAIDPETKEVIGGEKFQIPMRFSDETLAHMAAATLRSPPGADASDAEKMDYCEHVLNYTVDGVSRRCKDEVEAASIMARLKLQPVVQMYLTKTPVPLDETGSPSVEA